MFFGFEIDERDGGFLLGGFLCIRCKEKVVWVG